jgi:hypothetical protein
MNNLTLIPHMMKKDSQGIAKYVFIETNTMDEYLITGNTQK